MEAEAEDLPRYEEEGPDFATSIQDLLLSLDGNSQSLPIRSYPDIAILSLVYSDPEIREACDLSAQIVNTFYDAIRSKNKDVVAAMITNELVTPNTTGSCRETPLLAAVGKDDVRMVQCLVDFGAEIDALGTVDGAQRTPLQLAASRGHLALVRLFVEVFHADDALLAPDGELALRLAARNGHDEVVTYLPSRRKGGWQRWKTHHSTAMRRVRYAYEAILSFLRIIFYEIPKFFVWSCPKHLLVLPIYKSGKWCWKQRHAAASWCKHQAKETPRRLKRACKAIAKGAKKGVVATGKAVGKIPAMITALLKALWRFVAVHLPRLAQKLAKFLFVLITKHIPHFIVKTSKWMAHFLTKLITKWIPWLFWKVYNFLKELLFVKIPAVAKASAQWLWSGIKSIATALYNILERIISLVHTALMAAISRLEQITLSDVWNGLCSVFHAVFVAVPVKVWAWLEKIPRLVYTAMATLFGVLGKAVAIIGWILLCIVLFVPIQLGVILAHLGTSALKGLEEVLVWIDPKRK